MNTEEFNKISKAIDGEYVYFSIIEEGKIISTRLHKADNRGKTSLNGLSLDYIVIDDAVEEWKDVPGYVGKYQVSNIGRVKSLKRPVWNGRSYYIIEERTLKQHLATKGYYTVRISKLGIMKTHEVHVLMAKAFYNHIPCGLELVVDHKDHNRKNNTLSNLQLITHRENVSKDRDNKNSQYTGVRKSSFGKNFTAHIGIYNEYLYIGTFKSEKDAANAYKYILTLINDKKSLDYIKSEIKIKYAPIYSSKYKWVTWDKNKNKWIAQPYINGKRKRLGGFNTEEEANNEIQQRLKEARPS